MPVNQSGSEMIHRAANVVIAAVAFQALPATVPPRRRSSRGK